MLLKFICSRYEWLIQTVIWTQDLIFLFDHWDVNNAAHCIHRFPGQSSLLTVLKQLNYLE